MVSVNKLGHEYDLEGQVSVAPWGEKKEYHVSERRKKQSDRYSPSVFLYLEHREHIKCLN